MFAKRPHLIVCMILILCQVPSRVLARDDGQAVKNSTDHSETTTQSTQTQAKQAVTIGPDGLGQGGMYIEAQEVSVLNKDIIIAKGDVEMRYNGRILRADHVEYHKLDGLTIAKGHAISINADGSVQYGDELDTFETQDNSTSPKQTLGSGLHVASVLNDNTKIFSNDFTRVSVDKNILHQVLFTPCELCETKAKDGSMVFSAPVWAIQADTAIEDKKNRVIIYKNAVVLIKGVPVLYLPILWHPDPTVKRATGLLAPSIDLSATHGFSYYQPFYWAISPYEGIWTEARFNSKINPFLDTTFKRRFYSGDLSFRFGIGHDQFFDAHNQRFSTAADGSLLPNNGKAYNLGFVISNGAFKIDDNWRWNYTLEHVWDQNNANLFERYKLPRAFQDDRELVPSTRQLINQLNLLRQDDTSFFELSSFNFQSLELASYQNLGGESIRPIAINSNTLPTIEPKLEYHLNPAQRILGGLMSFDITGAAILRTAFVPYPIAPVNADGTTGFDTHRLTEEFNWQNRMVTPIGMVFEPFVNLRHDNYRISNLNRSGLSDQITHNYSTAGFNLSYPLYQRVGAFNITLLPQAQLALSPEIAADPNLPNEDSQSFDFDSTNLFKFNKSPGFDLTEGGKRLSLGMGADISLDNGAKFSSLLGRVIRQKEESVFLERVAGTTALTSYDPSGLSSKLSEWIVDNEFNTGTGFYGYSRLRLDSDTGSLRHAEEGLSISTPNTVATIRYLDDRTAPVLSRNPSLPIIMTSTYGKLYETTSVFIRHFYNKNWGSAMRLNFDIQHHQARQSEASLIYRDGCSWVELVYNYDDTQFNTQANFKPITSITVRINLMTFGDKTTQFANIR